MGWRYRRAGTPSFPFVIEDLPIRIPSRLHDDGRFEKIWTPYIRQDFWSAWPAGLVWARTAVASGDLFELGGRVALYLHDAASNESLMRAAKAMEWVRSYRPPKRTIHRRRGSRNG